MKIVHFCAGLEKNNGMANTARQFVAEELARGDESLLTNDLGKIVHGVDEVMIHGAWLPVLWWAARRTKAVGAKLLIRPAGSYDPVRLAYRGWKKRLVGFWERRMLWRADVVLATCAAEKEWIRKYALGNGNRGLGIRVEVTDLKRFFRFQVPGSRFQGGELHVLYLGRRHPLKGVECLVRAVEELNRSFEHSEPSNSRIFELRIVSNSFGDELEKVWDWADVLVLPTLSENFGRVVAEALERGKFVITTDGAPAWADLKPEQGIYLKGYRNGTPRDRVDLLRGALAHWVD